MRQRLIYLLKHYERIQLLYRVVMGVVFRTIGKVIKTDDHLILFVSFMGKGFNDSPRVLYDFIQNQPEYKDLRCVWAFEKPNEYPGISSVKIDTIDYFITALKAKYWITNTNIERGLKFKKNNQIYLNTWHGVALKHIGNDCPGRNDFDFSTVNYLVTSGAYDEKVFKSAFNAKDESFLRCGMPRNEELWNGNVFTTSELKERMNIPSDKKIILYAPTWRDSDDGGISYGIKPPIHFSEWENILKDKYIVLFRAHHQTTKVLGIEFNDFVRDVSNYPAVNDLMIVSDLLITDYSAIAFDYSILCKPILCYAYDYESYLKKRGTYFEIDDIYPNKSCRTESALLESIQTIDYSLECEKTKRFRDLFIEYGAKSTQECINAIFKNR